MINHVMVYKNTMFRVELHFYILLNITRPFYQNPLRPKIKIPYGKNQIVQEGQKTDFPRLENIFPSKFLKIRINYKKYTLQNE